MTICDTMQSNNLQSFEIEIYNLEEKDYEFNYEIGDKFFASIEDSLVEKGNVKVKIIVQKGTNLIKTTFFIDGEIELTCDRSLETYIENIQAQGSIIFKFGEEAQEISEELIQITYGTTSINVAQYIYEFISLEIPFKKLHPRFRNDEDESDEPLLIYQTKANPDSVDEDDAETKKDESPSEDDIDPRWKALLKLRKN